MGSPLSTEHPSTLPTLGYLIRALLTGVLSLTVTYYSVIETISALENTSTGVVVVALGVYLVLFFMVVVIVSVLVEDSMNKLRPELPDSDAWTAYGIFTVVGLASVFLVLTTIGVTNIEVARFHLIADSPYVSVAILAVTTIIGMGFLDGFETSDDEDVDPVEQIDQPVQVTTSTEESQSQDDNPRTNGNSQSGPDQSESDKRTKDGNGLQFPWVRETDVTMDEIGGMEAVKHQIHREVIRPLKTDRSTAEALEIPAPNILLYGPPGTGKTFFSRAIASELGMPFVELSGADVTSKWINQSALMIKQLFTEAKYLADKEGGAVIFLDELDAVLPSRSSSSHEENRKVVNEFLSQLQDTNEHNIVFLGATNRPDMLDEAATRNGRIDRRIEIGLPDEPARAKILRAQLDSRSHSLSDDELLELAKRTSGASAADLTSLVEDAARHAAFDRNSATVSAIDFEAVL